MVRVNEPGSIVMNCPYCGRILCSDKVDFVSTNIILRSREILPTSILEGATMRRLRAWCNACGVTVIVEKVTVNADEPEEEE